MKTKKFLLATAGATVDGRTIDAAMLNEMAADYDPATYGARLNIEHVRGFSGEKPFQSYGDVLSLETGDVELNIGGEKETRVGLYGMFDVLDNAKELNESGQKVYPSIEIEPNFAAKGRAYLMGCALTDSPASIGTEKLLFNRSLPGTIQLSASASAIEAAPLELVEAETPAEPSAGFFNSMSKFFESMTPKQEPAPPVAAAPAPAADPAALMLGLQGAIELMAKNIDAGFASQSAATTAAIKKVDDRCTELANTIELTPAPGQKTRPLGNDDNSFKTDC